MTDREANRFSARATRYARVGANMGGVAARINDSPECAQTGRLVKLRSHILCSRSAPYKAARH